MKLPRRILRTFSQYSRSTFSRDSSPSITLRRTKLRREVNSFSFSLLFQPDVWKRAFPPDVTVVTNNDCFLYKQSLTFTRDVFISTPWNTRDKWHRCRRKISIVLVWYADLYFSAVSSFSSVSETQIHSITIIHPRCLFSFFYSNRFPQILINRYVSPRLVRSLAIIFLKLIAGTTRRYRADRRKEKLIVGAVVAQNMERIA